MKRRTFLRNAALAAAASPIALGSVRAKASSPLNLLAQLDTLDNDKILVIVQLFGGNDGLNTVVPALDDNYYKIRPSIAIPKDKLWNQIGDIYLHPALALGDKGGLGQMLSVGTLAIVQGVGYDHPNLSHFRSTDIWLSGINNSDPNVRLDTGWIGRFLEQRYPDFPNSLPKDPLAINFGGFSLSLTSEKGRMGIEVDNPGLQAGGLTSGSDSLDDQSSGTHYAMEYAFIQDIANRSNVYAQRVKDAYTAGRTKLKANYSSDDFSQQMASVAALIAGGLDTKVYVVTLGGFDTHVNQQAGDVGTHPALLSRLGDGIAQFQYDLQQLDQLGPKLSKRVVGMTVSEFGRRPQENGSLGTDHGAASVQFLFGTQVSSAVYGHTPDLSNLDSNGDLSWQIDYRQIYLSILSSWFGMTIQDARSVLQDDSLTPIDIIKNQSGVAPRASQSAISVQAYPNPFVSSTKISISLATSSFVEVTVNSIDGKRVATVLDRQMNAGNYELPFSETLPSGAYLLTLRTDTSRITTLLHCVR